MADIAISSPLYARLLRRSVSFDDTPEDVIARLLDAVEDPADQVPGEALPAPTGTPAPPGSILPVGDYWIPILRTLVDAGGSAPANDVIDALEERMTAAFNSRDLEVLKNGEIRWRNRARFARLRMKERGLLSNESPRGVWEISDIGRAYLKLNQQGKSG
ncbi:MAG TPA: winged helix-turn-helix domain-containing protein [Solirubrobacterales bacterium]|nr:winged helix-turn-helix domain-containing protein [Solirubrobacterales bacterium]